MGVVDRHDRTPHRQGRHVAEADQQLSGRQSWQLELFPSVPAHPPPRPLDHRGKRHARGVGAAGQLPGGGFGRAGSLEDLVHVADQLTRRARKALGRGVQELAVEDDGTRRH